MMEIKTRDKIPHEWLLLLAMAFMCFNLRTAITAIDPLLKMIEKDVGISMEWSGAFALLPVAALGISSMITPKLSDYLSIWKVILIFQLLACVGVCWRSMDGIVGLYGGVLLLGLGAGVVGSCMPGFIKLHFPVRAPLYMGAYSACLGLGVTLSSATSAPIAQHWGGWRMGLGFWGLPMLIGVALWGGYFLISKGFAKRTALATHITKMLKKRIAWNVTIFYTSRIASAYFFYTWITVLLQNKGLSSDDAGFVMAVTSLAGIPSSLFSNWFSAKLGGDGRLIIISAIVSILSCWLIFYLPIFCILPMAILLGLGSGAIFARGMGFMVLRAKDEVSAIELSGMAQGCGFILGAGIAFCCSSLIHPTGGFIIFCLLYTVFNLISMIYGTICAKPGEV